MGQNVLIDGEVSHLVHDWCEIRGGRTGGRGYSPTPSTQQKMNNLFWPDENSIEQCFAAHIVQCCQQYCSTLLHLIAG